MTVTSPDDGLERCPWAVSAPDYVAYHDDEWGRPVRSVAGLYERLTLEAFQSGLSWLTILRKRPGFRAAFAGFVPEAVASFDAHDVERLMDDAAIVRNRQKIDAAIANAKVISELGQDFADLVWSYHQPDRPRPTGIGGVPAASPESTDLAKQLKKRGVRFVGPTTAYALMQAVGVVDDHLQDCYVEITGVGR